MNLNRISLLFLILVFTWRIFTWHTHSYVGSLGFERDDEGIVTWVSSSFSGDSGNLLVGDSIIRINDQDYDYNPPPDRPVVYTVKRGSGEFEIASRTSYYTVGNKLGLLGASILLIGLFIWFKLYTINGGSALVIYCCLMGFHWGGYPKSSSRELEEVLYYFYTYGSIFLGSSILHFSIDFNAGKAKPMVYFIIYSAGFIGIILLIMSFDLLLTYEPLVVSLYALIGALILFWKLFRSSRTSRMPLLIICLGILIANLPYLLTLDFGMDETANVLLRRYMFTIQPLAFALALMMGQDQKIKQVNEL